MKLYTDEIKYGNSIILNNSDIELDKLGIYHIKGKNGVGKSSLVNNLKDKYENLICLMSQSNDSLDLETSVLDNISMFQIDHKDVIDQLKLIKLEYILEKNIKMLSGGEKRIISLLRCLLSNKKILILDEPLNDLDYTVFAKAEALINEYSKKKAIILVSHYTYNLNIYVSYVIENKNLTIIKVNNNTLKILSLENNELNIYKIKRNYIHFLIMLILIIVIAVQSSKLDIEQPIGIQNDNLYYVTTWNSASAQDKISSGGVDFTVIQCLYSFDKDNCQNQLRNSNDIVSSLDTISEEITLYPLEFINVNTQEYHSLTQYIKDIILETDQYEIDIKYSINSFEKGNNSNEVLIPKQIYSKKVIDNLKKYDIQYSIVDYEMDTIEFPLNSIIYNDYLNKYSTYSITDAILFVEETNTDQMLEDLFKSKSLIITGDLTKKIIAESNNFANLVHFTKSIALFSTLLLTISIIIVFVKEKSFKKTSTLMFNYGYSYQQIRTQRKKSYMLSLFRKCMLLSSLLVCVIMINNTKSFVSFGVLLFLIVIYAILIRGILYTIRTNNKGANNEN